MTIQTIDQDPGLILINEPIHFLAPRREQAINLVMACASFLTGRFAARTRVWTVEERGS